MEHVDNVVVDDMYIFIPWGKEHAIYEVCGLRRRIREDRWVYVLDEWLNGGTMEAEIVGMATNPTASIVVIIMMIGCSEGW